MSQRTYSLEELIEIVDEINYNMQRLLMTTERIEDCLRGRLPEPTVCPPNVGYDIRVVSSGSLAEALSGHSSKSGGSK